MSLSLVTVVAFLVGYPLVRNNTKDRYKEYLEEVEELEGTGHNKEAIMSAINEIEFDYKMNKLSDEDYSVLKKKYKETALGILHEEEKEEFSSTKIAGSEKNELEAEIEAVIEKELKLEGGKDDLA